MCSREKRFQGQMLLVGSCLCLLSLIVPLCGCRNSAPSPQGDETADNVEHSVRKHFQGDWAGQHVVDPTRRYLLRLSFSANETMTADVRLVLANPDSPGGEQEYPGWISDYEYQAFETVPNEGRLLLTMTSKRLEGREKPLTEDDTSPRTWFYRVKGENLMEITKPVGQQMKTFVLHKEQ